MKLVLMFIMAAVCNVKLHSSPDFFKSHEFKKKYGKRISFIENKGQVHDQNYDLRPDVLYSTMTDNMAVHIKTTGVSYQLSRLTNYEKIIDDKISSNELNSLNNKYYENTQQNIYRIDLNWLNSNTTFSKKTDLTLSEVDNFYLENCPNGVLNVKSYSGITLKNLYNGIDLHYYERNGYLKHDYIVAPHANYNQIKIEVNGAQVLLNDDGSLILTTPLGNVMEGAPIVYQNGKLLEAKWMVQDNIISFKVKNYNPNYELIIDPVTRLWGTYYGGSGDEYVSSCETDTYGNVYLSGRTSSSIGIATVGAYDVTLANSDAYLVKFDASGIRQWATYYGGTSNEDGSCDLDSFGNIYLCGSTASSIDIASTGAHQLNYGGLTDAFLVKFNNSGVRQWSTYYGGSGSDYAYSCGTDGLGNVYMVGKTTSSLTGISSAGSHQTSYGGGSDDAFLVKFNAAGVRLWATYYGGAGSDISYDCATDVVGNVYIVGNTTTNSGNAIATSSAHQLTYGGGTDAFLVKFNDLGIRQWGTYYGGSSYDWGLSCSTSTTGSVYLSGYTASNNNIATASSFQTSFAGSSDNYIVKFDNMGFRQWSTYYGAASTELSGTCCVDALDNVYLSGTTLNINSPLFSTTGSYQLYHAGGKDAFLVKFNSIGARIWGTYYGGPLNDDSYSCSADNFGNIYMAGNTISNGGTAISSVGAHQTTLGGSTDSYLVKFTDCVSLSPSVSVNQNICTGSVINFTTTVTGTATPNYSWSGPNLFTSNLQNPVIVNASSANSGVYTVTVSNGVCMETVSTQILVSNCTDLKELLSKGLLNIYPNPSTGNFNVVLPSAKQGLHIMVTDALGKLFYKDEFINTGGNQNYNLCLSYLAKGVYYLSVNSSEEHYFQKIVIE